MQLSFKSFQPLLLSSSSLERGSILLNLFRTTYTSPSLSPIPSFSKKPSPQLPTRVFVFSKIIYNHLLNQIACPCHMLHLFSKWLSLGLDEYNMTYTIKRHQQGLKLKSSLPRVVHACTHTHTSVQACLLMRTWAQWAPTRPLVGYPGFHLGAHVPRQCGAQVPLVQLCRVAPTCSCPMWQLPCGLQIRNQFFYAISWNLNLNWNSHVAAAINWNWN